VLDIVKVVLSSRPWSFIMTASVVITAVAIALYYGYPVNATFALLSLIGAVMLHAFVNWFNDYGDYVRGVDRVGVGTAVYRPHLLLEGYLSVRQFLVLPLASAILAFIIGLYVALNGRPLVIPIGLAGLLIGFLYSYPPSIAFKYNALGELSVFIAFGPLMFLGAFYAATGVVDLSALTVSVPLGILIALVLLANNIRDIETDKASGIKTIAVVLGYNGSRNLYILLIAFSIIYTVVEVLASILPPTALITLAVIPQALSLARMARRNQIPTDFDPRTSKIVLTYSILLILSIALAIALENIQDLV